MTDHNLTDLVALSLLAPWRWRGVAERLRSGARPDHVLECALETPGDSAEARVKLRARARGAIARGTSAGLRPLIWTDSSYPSALAAIHDPPFVLWTHGVAEALHRPAVAIVGSRTASPYGLAVAGRLASDLAARGIVIVSGLARGVDSAAHRGALAGGGLTVAVLGSGADVVYPSEHTALAAEIRGRGLVSSELAPGTTPRPHFFPLRNRIISGLSRAVVVIEAGDKSGSLITARTALEQGREVLAVPGNVLSGRNRGAHALLRDGARIVESADDILEELGLPTDPGEPTVRPGGSGQAPTDPVLACFVAGESINLDDLSERSGLRPSRLLPRLLELELAGVVARVGGGRFVRS